MQVIDAELVDDKPKPAESAFGTARPAIDDILAGSEQLAQKVGSLTGINVDAAQAAIDKVKATLNATDQIGQSAKSLGTTLQKYLGFLNPPRILIKR